MKKSGNRELIHKRMAKLEEQEKLKKQQQLVDVLNVNKRYNLIVNPRLLVVAERCARWCEIEVERFLEEAIEACVATRIANKSAPTLKALAAKMAAAQENSKGE